MNEDFLVPSKSAKEIEAKTLAWRDALDVSNAWAPDVINLFEKKLPRLFPTYALTVRSDEEMFAIGDAEAYTEFNPPLIAIRNSVYLLARHNDGRARMTFAHEFGHLVLHPGAAKLRIEGGNQLAEGLRPFESAEWQARKFGAYFLLPTHIVRQFSSPREMAEGCHVSFQAAEIRFQEVGHIRRPTAQCVSDIINATNSASPKFPKPKVVK
jgi:Zn-dependent peptidase ImmA (M78 family)